MGIVRYDPWQTLLTGIHCLSSRCGDLFCNIVQQHTHCGKSSPLPAGYEKWHAERNNKRWIMLPVWKESEV